MESRQDFEEICLALQDWAIESSQPDELEEIMDLIRRISESGLSFDDSIRALNDSDLYHIHFALRWRIKTEPESETQTSRVILTRLKSPSPVDGPAPIRRSKRS